MPNITAYVETKNNYVTNNPNVGQLLTAKPYTFKVTKETTFRDIWDEAARQLGHTTKRPYAVYAQVDDKENFFWVVSEEGGFATYLIKQRSSFPRQYDLLYLEE